MALVEPDPVWQTTMTKVTNVKFEAIWDARPNSIDPNQSYWMYIGNVQYLSVTNVDLQWGITHDVPDPNMSGYINGRTFQARITALANGPYSTFRVTLDAVQGNATQPLTIKLFTI